MKTRYKKLKESLTRLRDLPILLMRLVLAYGFYKPAMMKLSDVNGIAEWFESMSYPLPKLSAYLVTGTETAGVILLTLGLATRFISIPLLITMLVAITTVHWGAFDAGSNGFEIPLYYFLILLFLLFNGPGKISLDYLISKKVNNSKKI